MSRFRASIEQLPTWPGLVIAAALILGLGGWYYGSGYARCSELEDSREALRVAIDEAARQGRSLDLAAAFPGDWDEVRIAQAHRLGPGQAPYHCPFGWDWSRDERQALIESGRYTVIGFFDRGRFQRYVEYRSDWARFEGDIGSIERAEARFDVERSSTGATVLRLAHP